MAGSLIPESPELTYTRAEFELAQKLGRPVFAFFKTEGGVPVNKETDADKKRALDDFKNAVTSAGITPAYFDLPDRLTRELLLAVTNWNAKGRPGARRVFTTPKEFFAPFESDAPRLFDFKQTIRVRERAGCSHRSERSLDTLRRWRTSFGKLGEKRTPRRS